MYHYPAQSASRGGSPTVRNRVMVILLAVLLAAVIILGIRAISLSSFRSKAEDQLYHSMTTNISSAISVANRLDSSTSSSTTQSLGLVRQYVYAIEQANQMIASLTGKRYVPTDAFSALYTDLDNYQSVILSNKGSVIDTRELLIQHLNYVLQFINGTVVF